MESQSTRVGRPRSEQARAAVLNAVDDLLLEVGYAAMTMKGIAERAGVGRQTVYRWWATKAEILFEACIVDAREELAVTGTGGTAAQQLATYLDAVVRFLAHSPAGAAYRALLGEAQHDTAVATLVASRDVLLESARVAIERAVPPDQLPEGPDQAAARLVGPVVYWMLSGRPPGHLDVRGLAATFLGMPAPERSSRRG